MTAVDYIFWLIMAGVAAALAVAAVVIVRSRRQAALPTPPAVPEITPGPAEPGAEAEPEAAEPPSVPSWRFPRRPAPGWRGCAGDFRPAATRSPAAC